MSIQKATLALGCFWHPDDFFSKVPGVSHTTAGYSGGQKINPTYHDLGDHTESVEISFDPEKISYTELLKHFWQEHNPTLPHKTQYKSIIFYHDAEQKKLAEQTLQSKEQELGKKIATEIRPAQTFYRAEDYHQKYYRKNNITNNSCRI